MLKKEYLIIFFRLICQYLRDFLKNGYFISFGSMLIWGGVSLFVSGRILPQMGMGMAHFGLMQFCGIIAGIVMQIAYRDIYPYIMDFEDKRNIYSELSYPVPPIYLFLAKMVSQAISYFFVTVSLIPFLKLILWNELIFSSFLILKFFLSVFCASLFFSAMVFFIVSWISQIRYAGLAWNLFLFPMWFLGGFQFSWNYLYQCNKIVAILDLLNPIIYINESIKIAVFNHNSFLSYWWHIFFILFFTGLFFIIGYKKIISRLDVSV